LSISIERTLPQDEWRRFVDEHPAGNIFHTPEMFQVFSLTQGYRPELWAAVKDGRPLALFLPVRIALTSHWLRRFTSRAVIYGSVLCAPTIQGKKALAALLHQYKQEVKGALLFTELRNLSDLTDIQPILNECGFSPEGHLNYLIDLEPPAETIWCRLSKKTRQHVQKARRCNITVEEMTEAEKIKIVYKLINQVYNRVGVPLPSFTLFQSAFDTLFPRGMLRAVVARVDDQYVAANLLLTYKDVIFDWYRGSDRTFSSCYPEPLMIWEILQWGRERGFHWFDFGGAGKPDEDYGPRVFKSRWGGTLVNYGRNTYIHAPIRFKLSRAGYQIARKFLWSNTYEQ